MVRRSGAHAPPPANLPAAHASEDSTTDIPTLDNDDEGFITPRGPTTPLASAVPQPIATTTVTTSNRYDHDKFDFGLEDEAVGPSAATPATTLVLTYQDIQRAVNETFKLIIADIRQSKIDHERRLTENYRAFTSNATTQHQTFEARHSSFLGDINAEFRAVKQTVGRTVDSFSTNFVAIDATLTKVEASTTRMSGLLEENWSQLQQLHDNKAARVAAMQEQRDRLDNMDAMLTHVTDSVMKTVYLAQELDSKILASRPVEQTTAPGFVSPARPSANKGTHPPHVDSSTTEPDDDATMSDYPAAQFLTPHRFNNINLGPAGITSQRALSYPSGNWSSSTDGIPPTGRPQVHFEQPTDYRFNDSCPPTVDTSVDKTKLANEGGHVVSPRPSDKERQARHRWTSLFDVAGLASLAYHGGRYSIHTLEIPFMHLCGYQTISPAAAEDVLLCYRNIQQVHKKVRQGWINPCTQISGPSVERILEKGLLVFPKLKMLMTKDTVHFYDKLQELLAGYLLLLMPFNVIRLEFNFEGLFIPGLGTECYANCATALMEVLPCLLPALDSEVQVAISAIRGKSKNGYDLFWHVLELAVPGFDPTIPIDQPWWVQGTDVLEFSRDHELYFRLLAKKHVFIDARTRMNMFLHAITSSEYADVITTVQSHVDVFWHKDNDGFLPTHLRLCGIANMLHQNAKAQVRDVGLP
jgi:hypothetical protein